MIDVTRLGHPDRRMQQQHPIDRGDGPLGQLLMYAVQRVSRLERHHVLTTGLRQHLADLGRSTTQLLKVIVTRELEDSDGTRRIEPAPAGHLVDQRVFGIVSAEHPFRQIGRIPGIQLVDGHDREQIVHRVAQRDVSAGAQSRIGRNG